MDSIRVSIRTFLHGSDSVRGSDGLVAATATWGTFKLPRLHRVPQAPSQRCKMPVEPGPQLVPDQNRACVQFMAVRRVQDTGRRLGSGTDQTGIQCDSFPSATGLWGVLPAYVVIISRFNLVIAP